MANPKTTTSASKGSKKSSTASKPTIGSILRKTREEKGYQIQDVAHYLRISECYLEALENEDFDQLPERVYTLGFLRNYANFLDLSTEELVSQFQKSFENTPQKVIYASPKAANQNQIPKKSLVSISATIAVLTVLGWSWWHHSQQKQLWENAVETAPILTEEDVATQETEATQPEPAPVAEKVEAQPVEAQPTAEEVKLPTLPIDELTLQAGQPFTIKAVDRSWIELQNPEGKVLLSRIFSKGDSRTYTAQEGMKLSTGNAGGLVFVTDLFETTPLGKNGQVLHDVLLPISEVVEDAAGSPAEEQE